MQWGWREDVGAQEQRRSGSCSLVKAAFEAGGQKGQMSQALQESSVTGGLSLPLQ